MARVKYAKAYVIHPNFGQEKWSNYLNAHRSQMVRTASSSSKNLVVQASEILGEDFDPKKYLLTHSTIVASIDTIDVPGAEMGRVRDPYTGAAITRKWANYRVKPETSSWINNNCDSWDRPVLLQSYRSFVGAHNFCEHIQIEAQSKGRVIDAIARDIGPSVYIDILTATDRKHAALIRDIEEGRMGTLSMGCVTTLTTCTKCGNVASDESDLCSHIRYEKGNTFYDDQGIPHKVAETCGHHTLPNGGVQFNDASWVATPAFTGAVLRNIISPEVIDVGAFKTVMNSPPPEWTEGNRRAAAVKKAEDWDFGDTSEEETKEEAPKEDADPLDKLVTDTEQTILDRVQKRLKDRIQKNVQEEAAKPEGELATSSNDNLVKQAKARKTAYRQVLAKLVADDHVSDGAFIGKLAVINDGFGIYIQKRIYKAALQIGSTAEYPSLSRYISKCAEVLGRPPKIEEVKTLIRIGHLLEAKHDKERRT